MVSRHEEALEGVGQIIAAAEADPIHAILREWHDARTAECRALDHYGELEVRHRPCAPEAERYREWEVMPATQRGTAAFKVLSRVVPTTPAGLYAQLAVAFNMEWSGPLEDEAGVIVLQSAAEAAKRLIAASGATIN